MTTTTMPFFYPTANDELKGKNLVIPVVSTANVPQLTADVLIASLSLRRVGIFDPRFLIPVVGGRDDGEEGHTTPLELYGKEGSDILIIQQRSPVLKAFKQEFIDSLLKFLQNAGLSSVLFLSGMNLTNRTDAQMFTPTYHIHPPNTPPLRSPLTGVIELQIPTYTSPVLQKPQTNTGHRVPFIPGGGLTRRILSSFPDNWSVPTVAILQFVAEGDNRGDAIALAITVSKILNQDIAEWKQPDSWRHGLFGAPPDEVLYG